MKKREIKKKKIWPLILISAVLIGAVLYFLISSGLLFGNGTGSFEITPSLFKIILDRGDEIDAVFNIENFRNDDTFNFKVGDLNGMLALGTTNMQIGNAESEKLNVEISAVNAPYGVHVGHLSVSNSVEEKKIPVILSVHTKTQLFALSLNLAPDSKQIGKGDELSFEAKIFKLYDVSLSPTTVKYEIFNLDGDIIFSDSEEITISSSSSTFTKRFSFSEDIALGDYVFAVTLNNLDTTTTASFLFSVTDKKELFSLPDINADFLAILVIIFVAILFFIVLMILYERQKLFHQLRKQQFYEIEESRRNISAKKRKYLSKAVGERQKKKILEEFSDAKAKILAELRKQHRKQLGELKSLKARKVKYQERKLKQWKKQGYSRALQSAQIGRKLKSKLAALKTAYSEGFIKEESYKKGVSEIGKKLRRKHL